MLMAWLRDHAFLAAWLALPVSVIGMYLQNARTDFKEIDWNRSVLYLLFCVSIGVVFTPTFDKTARDVAMYFLAGLVAFFIVDRKAR